MVEGDENWELIKLLLYPKSEEINRNGIFKKYEITKSLIEILRGTNQIGILDSLIETKIMKNIVNLLEEKGTEDVASLRHSITEILINSGYSAEEYLILVCCLSMIYIKENSLGPKFFRDGIYGKEGIVDKEGSQRQMLLCSNPHLQKTLVLYFSKSGEEIYTEVQFLLFILIIEIIMDKFLIEEKYAIWRARLALQMNRILTSNIILLQHQSLDSFEIFLNIYLKTEDITFVLEEGQYKINQILDNRVKEQLACLQIEYGYAALSFFKYKLTEDLMKKASCTLNFHTELTGKLGKRTKYQTTSLPQLTLVIKETEEKVTGNANEEESNLKYNINLEEESILFESPVLDPISVADKNTTLEEYKDRDLTKSEELYLLLQIEHMMRTHPKDELESELLSPYIHKILDKSHNWIIFSYGLLVRSRIEHHSNKRRERSVLQIQALLDQYAENGPLEDRFTYYYALKYPFIWELCEELANCFMSLGVFLSAYDLLKSVKLNEKAVLCLILSGKRQQAENEARELIHTNPTPNIYCLLADVVQEENKKIELYYKAWEISGERSARSMRSLAKLYLGNGNTSKCIECFQLSLKINGLNSDAWFTLGCVYIKISEFEKAINSFLQVIQIEDESPDSWSNMALCYMKLEKFKQALVAYEHALQRKRDNYKIWNNYLLLNLELGNFHKSASTLFFFLQMNKLEFLLSKYFARLANIFLSEQEKPDTDPRVIQNHKERLFDLLIKTTEKKPSEDIWCVYADIVQAIECQSTDPSELQKGLRHFIDLKMKQTRAIMSFDWDTNLDICGKVGELLRELMEAQQKGGIEPTLEWKYFYKNTIQKIEKSTGKSLNLHVDI